MSFLLKIVVFHASVPSCLHLHISSLSIGKCQYIWGYCENMTTIIQDEQYSKSHQSHHTIFIYVLHINYTIYIIPYNTILSYIYIHMFVSHFVAFTWNSPHSKCARIQAMLLLVSLMCILIDVAWRKTQGTKRCHAVSRRTVTILDDIGWSTRSKYNIYI